MFKSRPQLVFYLYGLLALMYVVLSLVIPSNTATARNTYHLTLSQIHYIVLTLVIPTAFIWLISFYGYQQLQKYAASIRSGLDVAPMNQIANGLLYLALYLPISSIVSLVANYAAYRQPRWLPASVIIRNYAMLVPLVIAFYTLLKGSNLLLKVVRPREYQIKEQLLRLFFVATSAYYTYSTLVNPARRVPTHPGGNAAYYLSDALIILTIILPSLFIWYAGMVTAFNIHIYCTNVSGVLYRRALNLLAYGIGITAASVLAIRFLSNMSSLLDATTALKVLLLIIYILVIVIGIGFALIAYAAKKLYRIEQV